MIRTVNEIVGTLATAVEERSSATREIASNIAQASQGIQDVNENVSQSSMVATQISQEINMVNQLDHNIYDFVDHGKKKSRSG